MGSMEGPLVSFCVKCYNQERYIGEALEGVFAQTYRPLEIVISDDASTDRSWEIIQAAVFSIEMRRTWAISATGCRYVRLRKAISW